MSQITTRSTSGGGGGGAFIQQVYARSNAAIIIDDNIDLPIPYDNTIPQITEGKELITVTITPTDATNTLYIRFECMATNGVTDGAVALFQDANVDAIAARNCDSQQEGSQIILTHIMTVNTLAATTFSVRYGLTTFMTGNDAVINGDNNNNNIYGGVSYIVLYVYEMTS